MKKYILWFCSVFLFVWLFPMVKANTILSAEDHQMLDKLLRQNHNLSIQEKKTLSESYGNVAKIAKYIYNGVIKGDTGVDEETALLNKRIENIKGLSKTQQQKELEGLKHTQQMAEELERSFQIESEPGFEWYAVTKLPTPLYWQNADYVNINRIMWWTGTTGLKLDSSNTIDELWVVLPPNRPLTLIKKIEKWDFTYYEVRTREFDTWLWSDGSRFIDERLITKTEYKSEEHIPQLPSKEQLIKNMLDALGTQYIRWWSRYQWIPEMNELYPTPDGVELSDAEKEYKILKWTDCSWLLRQASDGYTPRNSRWFFNFWEAVSISWNTVDEIIQKVQPLDTIAWAGHVIIILNKNYAIESIRKADFQWGPELVDLKTRLEDIFTRRVPVNNWSESPLSDSAKFVIRRRYPSYK